MTASAALYPFIGLLVLAVPGALLALTVGVRDKLWLAALSVPASIGVFVVAGVVSAVPGIAYGPVLVGVLTLVLAALLGAGTWWVRRRRALAGPGGDGAASVAPGSSGVMPTLSTRFVLLAQLAAAVMCLVAVVLAVQPWRTGLGSWDTYPQEHDTIIHTVLVGYVSHTGNAAPWELLPLDVLSGAPVSFYPSGLPLAAALTGDLTGGPIVGFNVVNALCSGPVFALGAAALAAAVFRKLDVGKGWTALAGGFAAIVAAGLYRPGVNLLHDGGIAPNAVAMSLAPGVIAALLTIGGRQWARAIVLGIGVAGIFSVHPSTVATVGLSVLVFWVVEACTAGGRRTLRAQWPVVLTAGGVAILAALGQVIGSAGQAARTGDWPPDIDPAPLGDAVGTNLMLTYGGFWDSAEYYAQASAGILALVGAIAVLLRRRAAGALAMWLFWLLISIDFKVSPAEGIAATVGSFFYKAYVRVQSHISLFVPVMAAIGVLFVAYGLAKLLAALRRVPRAAAFARAPGPVAAVVVVLLTVGYVTTASVPYEHMNAAVIASRYLNPEFERVGDDDRRAGDWLAAHVRPGERVMNSANDGSTYAYINNSVPIVNVVTLGAIQAPYTFALLKSFREYPTNPRIRDMVLSLNVSYVYVDSTAPVMGAGPGAPNNWLGEPTFTLAPGLRDIDTLPGISVAFRSGSVTVYKLDQRVLAGMRA